MADQEDEELRMAMRMSMQQHESPEPKRSKPWENAGSPAESLEESPDVNSRKVQRELMAAAAERRMLATRGPAAGQVAKKSVEKNMGDRAEEQNATCMGDPEVEKDLNLGEQLSPEVANQLFFMVFGNQVTRDILAQWSNQGIRYDEFSLFCFLNCSLLSV